MTIKKSIITILLSLILLIPNILYAGSTIWDLNIDTEYTLSAPTLEEVLGGVGRLKMLLQHQGSIINGAGGALLNQTQGIQVVGNYAYLTSRLSNALEIVDISNPLNPTHVGAIADGGAVTLRRAQDLVIDGNYAYIAVNRDDAVQIVDISNPANPTHVSSIGRSATIQLNGAIGIEKVGNLLYVAAAVDDGLEILDVTDPFNPVHVGALTDAVRLNGAEDIKVVGNYAYMTSETNDSFEIIDISNPANPIFVGELINGAGGANLNGASGIAISGNYAYIASNIGDAIEVIDISNPANPIHAGLIINGGTTLLNGPENISIDGDYAYITSTVSDAIEVIDISNPSSPTHVTSVINGGTTLLNGAKDLQKIGDYIYVASDVSDALEILKVSYDNTSPNIIPNNPLLFSGSVDLLTSTLGIGNQGNITYQISKDNGVTWYYLNGTTWQLTTAGTIESNTPAEINYEIQSFNGLAGGTGEFKWKAFLNGDGTQRVELDEVQIDSTNVGTNEIIDFEAPGGYTVTVGTWTRQSVTVQEGIFSIEANNAGANNSTSCFDVTKTIYNPSTINFYKSVDSEATFDFLRFYINGVQQTQWSGTIGWSQESYAVGNGNQTFTWCYEKDGSVNNGADTAWVDYIEIIEDPIIPTPVITDIIDFETATGYTVIQGIWNRQTVTVQEGSFSAQADNLGVNNSQSCFDTTKTLASDSTISFWKSVDSEATYDFLRFYVDGGLTGQWSGTLPWAQESYSIIAGTHTFKWCYEKDASVSRGADTAWVDYIEISTDPNPPVEIPVLDFEIVGGYTVTTAITNPGPDWTRVTTEKYEGLYSIESQNQNIANSASCFERVQTVSASDTGIAFYKKVSSIAAWPDYDHLVFYINNVEQTRWSGSAGRSRELYNLAPNTYTLKWCYEKNGTGDDPIDKAWIDFVSVTQDSPVLTEISPVNTPTNDNTPSYTFNSTISGDISYGGSCSSATTKAVVGDNTIVFNSLADGIYTDCTIQVLGANSNSIVLPVSNFTIDTTRITNTINYPVDTTTIVNTGFDLDVSYSDATGVDTNTIIINLYKYDTVSGSYGSDIAATYVDYLGATIGGTGAIYPISQLGAGQYQVDFTISDTTGNASVSSSTFYINESPLLLTTTINNSGGGIFNYEFTINNISPDNITNWVVGFQLDGGTIDTTNGGTFSNNGNLFQVISSSPTTDTFVPGQTHTITFSGTGNGIVTNLYLISYTNLSPAVPIDYNITQNGLDVAVTTDSITGNQYCRNVALTNTNSQDITNWQIQFDIDQIVDTTLNGSFSQAGITHTIDPLGNANIAVGVTENIKFCTTGLLSDNNWVISLVTLSLGDIVAPTISSTAPIEQETKTTGTFDFIFNYSDDIGGDGIDITSDEVYLYQWDGTAYGPDIAGTNMFLGSKTITTTTATYPSNNIVDGQYKVTFKIFDLNNNFATISVVFYVGIPPSDNTAPIISSTLPTTETLLPAGNHSIEFNYTDEVGGSGIDTVSNTLSFDKWDGLSWNTSTGITNQSTTTTKSIYTTSNLLFGKYRTTFNVSDIDGNISLNKEIIFYVDQPELIISTGALDIGGIQNGVTKYSTGISITVNTVGAGFDVILNKPSALLNGSIEIIDWNTIEGVGYDKDPYTSTINLINTNEVLATQAGSINVDGFYNTYVYSIKLGVLVGEDQAAGNYTGTLNFGINLNY